MTDFNTTNTDPSLLDKQDFKKYVQSHKFQDLPQSDKLNIVYYRLPHEKAKHLIEITRKHSLEEIISEHTEEIYSVFDEVKLVTLDIKTIVNLIKDFDDGI